MERSKLLRLLEQLGPLRQPKLLRLLEQLGPVERLHVLRLLEQLERSNVLRLLDRPRLLDKLKRLLAHVEEVWL